MEAALWYQSNCELGEGPVWHAARNSFFWVNVEGKTLFEQEWNSGLVKQYTFPQRISVAVPGREDELIVGLQGGVARFHLTTKSLTYITDLGINWDTIRCNDGRADHAGCLWIGTMPLDGHEGTGNLYCMEPNGNYSIQQPGVMISNGMAWTADNSLFYYTDSATHEIWCYNNLHGSISNRRTVITIPEHLGLPDGMAIDVEGMLWIALYGGSGVGRWNPHTGEMTDFITLPVPLVTSCAFAGKDLNRLMITTAAGNGGGHVYTAVPGVKGTLPFNCMI